MKAWPECIPCMLSLAVNTARRTGVKDERVREILTGVLDHGMVGSGNLGRPTPYALRDIWRLITEMTGRPDALRTEKIRQNQQALILYPEARSSVFSASDPLAAAVKLAVAGNMLDAVINLDAATPEKLLDTLQKELLDSEQLEEFRRRLATASSIVYFTDNCGEVVFDRLLLQVIRATWGARVTVVVREMPTVNDATGKEALEVGIDHDCDRLLSNGIQEPLPSTDLSLVSDEVQRLVAEASLVISKGIGNFELLEEDPSVAGKTTYLIHAKCVPMAVMHGVRQGSLILINR